MFSKVLAVVVLLAVAYCQEHSHSYKLHTLVKHEEPKTEHHSIQIPIQTYHAAPSHEYYSGGQSNGHAVSSQSIIRHDSGHQEQSQGDSHHYIVPVHHEPAPVHEIVSIKAAPRIEIQSGGQSHGHAVSSQSIIRHDSGHKEQSQQVQGGSHYVVATPVHQTVSLHSGPIQEVYSGGQSYGHAVSSQNIIRHDNSHKEQSQQSQGGSHYVVATPVHQTVSLHSAPIQEVYSGGQSYGHAISSQNVIHHDNSHKEQSQQSQGNSHYAVATPVHQTVSLHSAPIQEVYSGGQSYGHAVSSQNIVRHDNSHKEQSQQAQGGSHYVVAAPVHQTLSLQSAQENHSSGKSYGHAVSSQSIIRHESGHKEQSQGEGHYFLPIEHHSTPIHTVNLHAAPSHDIHSESHGHAVSSQNIVRHGNHKSNEGSEHYIIPVHHEQHAAPIHQTVIQATPIHHYIQESGHKEQSHQYEESDHEEYYAHPKYEFEYKVQDPHTGDNKFQHESRDGDVVKGVYSLHEADGSIRTVEYSADKHSGFNALVHNSEASKHEQQPHHH